MTSEERASFIQRLTVGYCEGQDRIYLDGCLGATGSVRMWLTHRLTERLIRYFDDSLMPESIRNISDIKRFNSILPQLQKEEEPVLYSDDTPSFLVMRVDIKKTATSIELTWHDGTSTDSVSLRLEGDAINVWCVALKKACLQAGWTRPVPDAIERHISESELITVH